MNTIFDINNRCIIDSTGLVVNYKNGGTGARSSRGHHTGKKYCEIKFAVDQRTKWSSYIGLSCEDIDLSRTDSFPANNSLFFRVMGDYPAVRIGCGDARADYPVASQLYTNPGVIGMAIDFDEQKIKYYINGSHLTDYSYINTVVKAGNVLYPYVLNNVAYVGSFNFNFGMSPFKYLIPAGYQAWDSTNAHLYLKDNAVYGIQ